jgi:hypothetical protein
MPAWGEGGREARVRVEFLDGRFIVNGTEVDADLDVREESLRLSTDLSVRQVAERSFEAGQAFAEHQRCDGPPAQHAVKIIGPTENPPNSRL